MKISRKTDNNLPAGMTFQVGVGGGAGVVVVACAEKNPNLYFNYFGFAFYLV